MFPSRRCAVFVNGCFWHQHPGCRKATIPATRREFWEIKLARNVERDEEAVAALVASGWRVLTIWECQTRNTDDLKQCLSQFLQDGTMSAY